MKRIITILFALILTLSGFAQSDHVALPLARQAVIEYDSTYRSAGAVLPSSQLEQRLHQSYIFMAEKYGIADSIKVAFMAGASKKRTSTIYKFYTNIYSLYGNNHGAQTTEASQPYVSGNIAPNEFEGMLNPNGGTRHVTHPTISFGATDAWSVTTVLNFNGDPVQNAFYGNKSAVDVIFRSNANANYFGFRYNATEYVFATTSTQYIGKNIVTVIVYDGVNKFSFYINGQFKEDIIVENYAAKFDFLLSHPSYTSDGLKGTISAHIIRSQALTPAQVAAEANLLRSIYPEIPSVQIDTQTWSSSNYDAIGTAQGNVIANVTEAANVEKVVNGGFDTDTDWIKNTGWVIGSGVATATNVNGLSIYQGTTVSPSKWYKVTYTITAITGGAFMGRVGGVNGTPKSSTGTYTEYIMPTTTSAAGINTFGATSGSIDNVSVEEVGWAGSQALYDGLISQGSSVYDATKAAAMWCYYNNDSQIGAVYGKLYNWFAVSLIQQDIDLYNTANPTSHWGWHVPTSTEFTTLQTYLGGSAVAGGKMKKEGLDYWTTPNTGATNESGFSGIGSSYRYANGAFLPVTQYSSYYIYADPPNGKFLIYLNQSLSAWGDITSISKSSGLSIRLIKD